MIYEIYCSRINEAGQREFKYYYKYSRVLALYTAQYGIGKEWDSVTLRVKKTLETIWEKQEEL